LILKPTKEHTATIIFMHGLGDTAEGWIDTAADYFAPALPHAKFILPTAPTRPITINGGMPMPGWYDIASLGLSRASEKYDGIEEARTKIVELMEAELKAGIQANRIVLAGFSQGGAMSLFVGLDSAHTLAGILVMSGYLPLPSAIHTNDKSLATPVLHLHGDDDRVVPLLLARESNERMKTMGVKDVRT
jgi:lysophospholipase-2